MKSKQVSIVHTSDPVNGPKKALDLIRADKILEKYNKILIKPNYVNDSDPSTGVTTDPKIVRAIIEYLLEKGRRIDDIAVAEGGMVSYDTIETFKKVGLLNEISGLGVKALDLNAGPHIDIDIPGAKSLKKARVSRHFLDYDCILSVPKLKVHCWSLTTLSMKNMMGAIMPKGIMHDDLHQKIVDLNRAIGPELTLIDGILGCQRHELACDPVNSNVLIAGEDFVATDTVGSYLMGLDPENIPYLSIANRSGLGINSLDKIELLGDDIEDLRKNYKM